MERKTSNLAKLKTCLAIIICIIIVLSFFLLNLRYFSRYIDSDIYAYTSNVASGWPPNMFNPHHLFYDYYGYIFYGLTKNLGNLGADIFFNQKIKTLVVSAVGAGLIFLFMYLISKKIILSLLFAGFIVFARGYLSYSSLNDTPMIHSVLCISLFFLLYYYRSAKHKKTFLVALGLLHALTVLFHQVNLLFFPVSAFFILFVQDNLKIKVKILNLAVYSITLVSIVASSYLYVGLFIMKASLFGGHNITWFNIKGAGNFLNWLSFYVHKGVWGKGFEGNTLEKVFSGFSKALCHSGRSDYYFDFTNILNPNNASLNVSFLFLILSLILFFALFVKLYKKHGAIIGSLLIWGIIYFAFYSWWEPEYFEFWLVNVSILFIMGFFVFNYVTALVKNKFVLKIGTNFISYSLILAAFLILFSANLYNVLYRRSVKKSYGYIGHYKDKVLEYDDLRVMYKKPPSLLP